MIVVLADDLSGAAELAGIASNRGLKTEVQLEFNPNTSAEVIALDMGTRALPEDKVAYHLRSILSMVKNAQPEWIYKKTDSVLRGHVRLELEVLADGCGYGKVLFLPANPRKNRVIRQGRYFVNDLPLDRTVFASDPDFPRKTADVVEALGNKGDMPVVSVHGEQAVPEFGIIIPDVDSQEDLERQVDHLNEKTLAAGAAEFFEAVITKRYHLPSGEKTNFSSSEIGMGETRLFVCGSLAAWEQGLLQNAHTHGWAVLTMKERTEWVGEILGVLEEKAGAVMAIGKPDFQDSLDEKNRSIRLLNALTDALVQVLDHVQVDSIFIEGGATAHAFIQRMGFNRLEVIPVESCGIGCLKPIHCCTAPIIFIKPGSYPWPDRVWNKPSGFWG